MGVTAAAIVVLALMSGVVGTSWALLRAWDAEKTAEENLIEAQNQRHISEEAAEWAETVRKNEAVARKVADDQRQMADGMRLKAEANLAYSKQANNVLAAVFTGLDPAANYLTVADFRNALRDNLSKAATELSSTFPTFG